MLQQANAQGITVVSSSGDSGAAACEPARTSTSAETGLAVGFPASSPYVTGVGGTEFSEGAASYWSATNGPTGGSALSYIPETAWNDGNYGSGLEPDLMGTGGGVSTLFPKPAWQTGVGVPNDGFRDVPDVSLAASPDHDGYLFCSANSCLSGYADANRQLHIVGGTSVSAPALAGIVALLNQKTGSAQGNINPSLYALASFSNDAFHDITTGNNQVPCSPGTKDCPGFAGQTTPAMMGYVAGPGYDQVTGLGSIDAYNLVNEWNSDFNISISPASLTLSPGGTGSVAINVTSFGTFAGTVSFTCTVPGSLSGTTCSIPGTVSGSGSATLTISDASHKAAAWPRTYWSPRGPIVLLLLAVSGCFLLGSRRRLALAPLALSLLTACGGGGAGTSTTSELVQPSVTGTVTVTATSGTLSHTATISVTE